METIEGIVSIWSPFTSTPPPPPLSPHKPLDLARRIGAVVGSHYGFSGALCWRPCFVVGLLLMQSSDQMPGASMLTNYPSYATGLWRLYVVLKVASSTSREIGVVRLTMIGGLPLFLVPILLAAPIQMLELVCWCKSPFSL